VRAERRCRSNLRVPPASGPAFQLRKQLIALPGPLGRSKSAKAEVNLCELAPGLGFIGLLGLWPALASCADKLVTWLAG
jgi:hypothetical protein